MVDSWSKTVNFSLTDWLKDNFSFQKFRQERLLDFYFLRARRGGDVCLYVCLSCFVFNLLFIQICLSSSTIPFFFAQMKNWGSVNRRTPVSLSCVQIGETKASTTLIYSITDHKSDSCKYSRRLSLSLAFVVVVVVFLLLLLLLLPLGPSLQNSGYHHFLPSVKWRRQVLQKNK